MTVVTDVTVSVEVAVTNMSVDTVCVITRVVLVDSVMTKVRVSGIVVVIAVVIVETGIVRQLQALEMRDGG